MAKSHPSHGLVPSAELANSSEQHTNKNQPIIPYIGGAWLKFLFLDLISVGLYKFYWIYENWEAIKQAEKRNISPFWRTIFSVFFVYSFFKRIYYAAKSQGYPKPLPYKILAVVYIIQILFWPLVRFVIPGLKEQTLTPSHHGLLYAGFGFFIGELVLWPILNAINFYHARIQPTWKEAEEPSVEQDLSVKFFPVSPLRFIGFTLLAPYFYVLYWSYKNWQAIKKAERSKIWPFWRAIFSILFIHVLFRKIYLAAKNQGYQPKFSYLVLAAIYTGLSYFLVSIIFYLKPFLPDSWQLGIILVEVLLGLLIPYICLWPMQKAINFYHAKAINNQQPRKGFTLGEVILIMVGILFYIFIITVGPMKILKSFPWNTPNNLVSAPSSD